MLGREGKRKGGEGEPKGRGGQRRGGNGHTARIPSPFPLCVAKTGSNHLNEEFTPLLPTEIGERF